MHDSRRAPRQRHAPLPRVERPGHPGARGFGGVLPGLGHVPRPSPGGGRRSVSPRTLRKAPGRSRTIDHNAPTPAERSKHRTGVASRRAARSRAGAHGSAGQSSRPLRLPAHQPGIGLPIGARPSPAGRRPARSAVTSAPPVAGGYLHPSLGEHCGGPGRRGPPRRERLPLYRAHARTTHLPRL